MQIKFDITERREGFFFLFLEFI